MNMIELNKMTEDYIAPEAEILRFQALERMAYGNAENPDDGGFGFETESNGNGGADGDIDEGE